MTVVSQYMALHRAQEEESAWRLLRGRNAALIMSILDSHFNEQNRHIPVYELVNLVEVDLEELHFRTNVDFGRSAQAACEQWRKDGYLIRRPSRQIRQETYELSAGAIAAIAYAKQLVSPRRAATQSRLNSIINSIHDLALSSSRDEAARREALLKERQRIDEQLSALDEGRIDIVNEEQGLESLEDIVNLLSEMPEDFARVRYDFEAINKSLYESIIGYKDGYQDILDDIFNGIDQISQSPSGRSFQGFYALLRNSELLESLQDDIDDILDTSFSTQLKPEQQRQFNGMIASLLDQSQEVNDVMTSLAHGLRRFVQNQNYQQEQLLKKELDRALGKAHKLINDCSPTRPLGINLELTSLSMKPIDRWKLHNPYTTMTVPTEEIEENSLGTISLAQLYDEARETEIDFDELVDNVNAVLADNLGDKDALSIADVLEIYPATQGIASVIGLMSLAFEQGRQEEGTQDVFWQTEDGTWREASIERLSFYQEVHA